MNAAIKNIDLRQYEHEVYVILLMHTVECATCGAEQDCPDAACIRRVLRETRFVLRHGDEFAAAGDE
ncbi:hypothetical protein ACFVYR_09915 [Streptomyces sp. NPDC058284]|uniref:hypothetical protein n=1 Tax=unclassified Streptomyces TaxID=2593676 RepID=UPI003649660C